MGVRNFGWKLHSYISSHHIVFIKNYAKLMKTFGAFRHQYEVHQIVYTNNFIIYINFQVQGHFMNTVLATKPCNLT